MTKEWNFINSVISFLPMHLKHRPVNKWRKLCEL